MVKERFMPLLLLPSPPPPSPSRGEDLVPPTPDSPLMLPLLRCVRGVTPAPGPTSSSMPAPTPAPPLAELPPPLTPMSASKSRSMMPPGLLEVESELRRRSSGGRGGGRPEELPRSREPLLPPPLEDENRKLLGPFPEPLRLKLRLLLCGEGSARESEEDDSPQFAERRLEESWLLPSPGERAATAAADEVDGVRSVGGESVLLPSAW